MADQNKKYKAAVIKAIFPKEYENSINLSDDIIEHYYKTDNIYLNAFQVPDQMSNINACHGLSKNIRTNPNIPSGQIGTDSSNIFVTPIVDNNYNGPLHMDINEVNTSYHKIFMGKDIDWENAYLRYAPIAYNILNEPIHYYEIDPNTGQIIEGSEGYSHDYIYNTNIPTYINNTYDLYTIIDFLLLKVKSLRYALNIVIKENAHIKEYNNKIENQNNQNNS